MSVLSVLMKRYFFLLGFLGTLLLVLPGALFAQDPTPVQPEPVTTGEEVEGEEEAEEEEGQQDLERRIDLLAEELERLRSGEGGVDLSDDEARARGLAPSAAAVFRANQGLSIAGYGEFLYENYAGTKEDGSKGGKISQFDALRAIIYTGYRFNDKWVFNSEIEIEHAKEAYLEFAYVDYAATENFGFRGGMLLVPMGLVNEFHEPTVFMGTERPFTENKIIPSTWRENGAGIYGAWDKVSFRLYAVNGFNGEKFSSGGLRGGRQKGYKAKLKILPRLGASILRRSQVCFSVPVFIKAAQHKALLAMPTSARPLSTCTVRSKYAVSISVGSMPRRTLMMPWPSIRPTSWKVLRDLPKHWRGDTSSSVTTSCRRHLT